MKRVSLLTISALVLMALLIVPACGEPTPPTPTVTFAITGPMTFIQGMDHWAGAEMARDEFNAGGGVDVGGVMHVVALEQVETNEILDVSGVAGTTALTAVIDDVEFVVGGFRTESVIVYREVAVGPDGADKIFMNCGAAPGLLQMSVVTDYENYKYFFKATPYNEVFLVTSTMKMTVLTNNVLRATLAGARELYAIPPHAGNWAANIEPLRFAIMMEDAEWCNPMEAPTIATLEGYGMVHVGTWKCESAASDLSSQLTAIADEDPVHIVFTIISGPPGKAYGTQQATYLPGAFSIGINVEAQDIAFHDDTGAEYHMTLDTWAVDMEVTPTTLAWFDSFVTKTSRYPSYCAAAYDAVKEILEGVEVVSTANGWDDIADVVSAANIDELIQHLETTHRLGVGANTARYPMPDIDLGGGTWALSAQQAYDLYGDDLVDFYGYVDFAAMEADWNAKVAEWTTTGGHIAHDTVYGLDYQTGIGSQWQPVDPEAPEGDWAKYGVWPMYLGPAYDALLTDRYGNWNFAYTGTKALIVPTTWVTAWLMPPA